MTEVGPRFDDRPAFDALYAVSDLHIGGRPGRQIFNQSAHPRPSTQLARNGAASKPWRVTRGAWEVRSDGTARARRG
jgi:hypothetical protein